MIDAPAGTPYWAWLLGLLIAIGIPALLTWMTKTRADVGEIKEQVKNTHATNLREDVDRTAVEARSAKEAAHRIESYLEDLDKSLRAIEHSLDRRDKLQTAAISEVREDLAKHLADCQPT